MIVVHARLRIDPDRREAALDIARDLVEETREEEGVLAYAATTDVTEPNVIRFFERYEDEAALAAHNESDHYREFQAELPEILDFDESPLDAVDVTQFDVDDAFDPNADVDVDADGE